jgi:hypothetical protein
MIWLPDNKRMLPETLEKLLTLVNAGAIVVGDAPQGLATLSGGKASQQRFDAAVKKLWGKGAKKIQTVGKGKVLSGMSIDEAVKALDIVPDVKGDALWLHRQTEGADWYYVCAPYGGGFQGEMSFNKTENVEIWDPVSGESSPAKVVGRETGRTSIKFDLARGGSCFVVFGKSVKSATAKETNLAESTTLSGTWTLGFPSGWGAPASIETNALKAWKDLDISPEGKAFSGTVTYSTTFDVANINSNARYSLDLGHVDMIATVTLNGKKLRTLWASPYCLDVTDALKAGSNILQIEVTGTWFNRLVYDAGQPEEQRKTWTINGPKKDAELRESGLLGPVVMTIL